MSGPLAPRAYDLPMQPKRTPAWWLVRLELAAGLGVTLLVGQQVLALTHEMGYRSQVTVGPLTLQSVAFAALSALAIPVAGLVWMVRILRGPRNEPPPPWRYRDR